MGEGSVVAEGMLKLEIILENRQGIKEVLDLRSWTNWILQSLKFFQRHPMLACWSVMQVSLK